MRIFLITLCVVFGLIAMPAEAARSRSSGSHYSHQGGHYSGGKGSSHKGGHYKNARTNDHYTKHRK